MVTPIHNIMKHRMILFFGIMHLWVSNAFDFTKSIAHTGEATALSPHQNMVINWRF